MDIEVSKKYATSLDYLYDIFASLIDNSKIGDTSKWIEVRFKEYIELVNFEDKGIQLTLTYKMFENMFEIDILDKNKFGTENNLALWVNIQWMMEETIHFVESIRLK